MTISHAKNSLTLVCLHSFCIRGSIALCLSRTILVGVPSIGHLGYVHNHPKIIKFLYILDRIVAGHLTEPLKKRSGFHHPNMVTSSELLGLVELMVSTSWFL